LSRRAVCWLAAVLVLGGPGVAQEAGELAEEFETWLEVVAPLITEAELDYFLGLEEDYRRRSFIDEFWRVRDSDVETPRNEFKRRWARRSDEVIARFGNTLDVRSRLLLLNGDPGRWMHPSGRELTRCYETTEEIELWFYEGSERTQNKFIAVVFMSDFDTDDTYKLWTPEIRFRPRTRRKLPTTNPAEFCEEGWLAGAMDFFRSDLVFYLELMEELLSVPEPPTEWLPTFAAATTDLPAGAETFEAGLEVDFVGRNQSRTAVQAVVVVPQSQLREPGVGSIDFGAVTHRFSVLGEVIRDDRLLDGFRYQFEVAVPEGEDSPLPLVLSRFVRPGPATLRLRVEDLYGRRFARVEQEIDIPSGEDLKNLRRKLDSPLFLSLEEANEAAARGERSIRLVPPEDGEIQVGHVRFTTRTVGDFDSVVFSLNERPILTKTRPPFSVELDMGRVAATHRLRAVAIEEGVEVARDEIMVNHGGQRFRARIVEPYGEGTFEESVQVVVEVDTPDDAPIERLELFLNEQRVATLYEAPFVQPVLLVEEGLAYLRAVAFLEDGNSTEDIVFINAPGYLEEVDIQYVELFATVVDGKGRPRTGLGRGAFEVFEDDEPQDIRRFEFVRDLPIHAGLLLDTSASMTPVLPAVVEAAQTFVDRTVQEQDRLAIISFDDRPRIDLKFSNDTVEAGGVLAGLRAGGSTALYDSLVYALTYFDGVNGQKALLLLSDGKDEGSGFDVAGAVETARRSGVTVYTIGLSEVKKDRDARKVLERIAGETGGQSFFVESPAELPGIYDSISEDLRSRYLLTYQSTSTVDESEFRSVRVAVDEKGARVRTISGYYP